jgi:hypothetical protein
MVVSGNEDLLERAFQLAFFIVPDRASAYEIAARAVEKLGLQSSREKRRVYWRGRNAKLKIRRISRPDADTLQWLVYLESEECEKEQERNDRQTETDLVIRYIKYLVQLTTSASSFYVNVGLNRLLRNYSTSEVQQVYEFTTEHYPASEEYRKIKGRLMNQLAARFDGFVKIRTSEYRELKFETDENQKQWAMLVEECLEGFTPWSSKEACLRDSAELRFGDPGTGLKHHSSPNHVDGIETNRCHWFMHSPCYGELARKLGLDPPEERLSVPQFQLKNGSGQDPDPSGSGRKIAPLTEAEVKALRQRIDSSDARRQQALLQPLKIVAHGAVCAHLDPLRNEKRQFEIHEGMKLLEVRTETAGTDLTLATHWIDYTEWNGIAAGEYTIALKDRRQLAFKIVPAASGTAQEGGATVVVESCSSSPLPAWLNLIGSYLQLRPNLPAYAFASVLFAALGWLAATSNYRGKLAHQQSTIEQMAAQIASQKTAPPAQEQKAPQPAKTIATYFLASATPSLRGTDNPAEPVVTFAPGDSLMMLDLAVAQGERGSYRATLSSFPEEQELLRENLLKPIKKSNGWVVEVALPSAHLADRTHYLVTLETLDRGGRVTPVTRVLFEVRK